jgi:hypothetical protein
VRHRSHLICFGAGVCSGSGSVRRFGGWKSPRADQYPRYSRRYGLAAACPIRGVRDPHDHRLRRPDLLGKPTWWLPRRRDRALPTSKSTGKPLSPAWPRHGHHRRSMPTAQGEPAGPVQEPDKAAPQSRPSRTGSSGYDISRHRVSSGTHGLSDLLVYGLWVVLAA